MKKPVFILLYYSLLASPLYSQWTDAYIPDFKVNDDNLNSYQFGSSIGVDSAGNFVIVWNDSRMWPGQQFPWQVYCQRYMKDGIPINSNFRIGHDTAAGPHIVTLKDGRFIVLWVHNFMGFTKNDIYFQRFKSNGDSIGTRIKVNDTTYNVSMGGGVYGLSIDADSLGGFIICWGAPPYGGGLMNVYFQRYDSSGSRIGTKQKVNEANSEAELPDASVNSDGSFVICWQDDRFRPPVPQRFDIFMQRYNGSGQKIGSNVKVNDDTNPDYDQREPSIGNDKKGRTIIAWSDTRLFSPYSNIFYQMYDSNGNAISSNKRADVNSLFSGTGRPRTYMRMDKFFFIGWLDLSYANKEQFYGRRFDSLGNSIGNPYMIPLSSPGSSDQRPDDSFILGDRIYSTWTDNRNGGTNNYDIYCNIRGFQNPDTTLGLIELNETVKEFKLYPAYPNPFNPVTQIRFDLPKAVFVQVKIYSIIGEEITVLVNEFKEAGSYSFIFSGVKYPSGLYIYTVKAGNFTDTKKMVLVR